MEQVLEPISKIYDAAMCPEDWDNALTSVCKYTDAVGFNLFVIDHHTGSVPFNTSFGIPEELLCEYNAYYISKDPGIEYFLNRPFEKFYFNYLHTEESSIDASEYYSWLEGAGGARYYLANTFRINERLSLIATAQRNRTTGHAQSADFEKISLITPHLERAVRIGQLLRGIDLKTQAAFEALEQLPNGVVLISEEGRATYTNEAAKAIISRNDGFTLRRGKLSALIDQSDRQLQRLIRQAISKKILSSQNEDRCFQLIGTNEHLCYSVQVIPLRTKYRLFSKKQPVAMVLIGDPSASIRPPVAALETLYELTKAESRVAILLAKGTKPDQVCKALGISNNTLKTHRKRIYQKIRVSTQAQLTQFLKSI